MSKPAEPQERNVQIDTADTVLHKPTGEAWIVAFVRDGQLRLQRTWLRASQLGSMKHTCHWTGCTREVPPAMWGCREHWFKLPKPLRDAVWRAYVPGQEITKTPSAEYLAVAALVQGWIAGKVTINKDGSVVVHEDIVIVRAEGRRDE